MVKIRHVRRGHQGVYTCFMEDLENGGWRFNTVTLNVTEGGKETRNLLVHRILGVVHNEVVIIEYNLL